MAFFADRSLGVESASSRSESGSTIKLAQVFRFKFLDPPTERNYFLLKLTTETGLAGWGEGLALGQAEDEQLAARMLAVGRLIEGRDSRQLDAILEELWYGSGYNIDGLQAASVSAVDGALHDLEGRRRHKPIYELLGGKKRDRIDVYCTAFCGPSSEVHSVKQLLDAAKLAVAEGHRSLKWDPFVFAYMIGQGLSPQERSAVLSQRVTCENVDWGKVEEQFRLVRETVGPKIDLIIEGHGRLTPDAAIETAKRLEPFNIKFFESPVHHFDVEGTARVKQETSIPIAQGDVLFRLDGFRGLVLTQACNMLRPDVAHCGGLREAMEIAALAAEHGIAVAPHCTPSPVGRALALHYCAAIPNFAMLEFLPRRDLQMERELLRNPVLDFEDGSLAVPSAPGIGIEIREDALAEVS